MQEKEVSSSPAVYAYLDWFCCFRTDDSLGHRAYEWLCSANWTSEAVARFRCDLEEVLHSSVLEVLDWPAPPSLDQGRARLQCEAVFEEATQIALPWAGSAPLYRGRSSRHYVLYFLGCGGIHYSSPAWGRPESARCRCLWFLGCLQFCGPGRESSSFWQRPGECPVWFILG